MPDPPYMDAATKAQRREDYDAIANEPGDWLRDADNLDFAARSLEPCFSIDLSTETDVARMLRRVRLRRPILMLRGCGLECLLKALFLAKGGTLAKGGRYLGAGGRQHDLAHLAKQADFAQSPCEAGCYCPDEMRCHRSVLRNLLEEHGARVE